jgi:predicted adenine nucleotide alpha hydrolase (AANH) superfamily ATPase
MIHWNPLCDQLEEWVPKGGWNAMFSEQQKIQGTSLFFFFKNKKGFKENAAEIMVQMVLFKQIYPGLQYSEEQEKQLRRALTR